MASAIPTYNSLLCCFIALTGKAPGAISRGTPAMTFNRPKSNFYETIFVMGENLPQMWILSSSFSFLHSSECEKAIKKVINGIAKSPGPRLHTERICTAWRCASVTIKGEQHAVPLQTVNIIDILSAIWRAESFVVGANNEAFESRQLPARPDEVKWVTKTLPTGTTIKALQQQTSNKSVQHKEAVLGFWIESFFFLS